MAPGNARVITVEHCLDKEAIILGSHSAGSHSAGEQVLDALLLIITESIASGGMGLLLKGESKKAFPPKRKMCLKRSSIHLMTGPKLARLIQSESCFADLSIL